MKVCALDLEQHLPHIFCLTHTDRHSGRHTDRERDIFQTKSNGVQSITESTNPSETSSWKIFTKTIVSSIYIEEK